MQRAALFLDHGGALTSAELRPAIRAGEPAGDRSLASQLARAERHIIDVALARVDGDIDRAAADLRVSRATLYRRLAGREGETTG